MLEGVLVDLVPYGQAFQEREPKWYNGEAWFWARVGDRMPVTAAQIRRRHEEHAAERERHGAQSVMFGIRTKDGKPIGDFALNWVVPHHRLAMMGAAIGEPDYWGGGYGTDALLLIVEYAFDWLDLHKVWLMTMATNGRVARQMEKVGFHLEARQREALYADHAWVDGLIYGMASADWPGRAALVERLGLKAK